MSKIQQIMSSTYVFTLFPVTLDSNSMTGEEVGKLTGDYFWKELFLSNYSLLSNSSIFIENKTCNI